MIDQKKVLLCIASMGGGGAERQVCYLSKGLTKKNWEVHVALLRDDVNSKRLEESGGIIHRLLRVSNKSPIIIFQLISLIRQTKPHLVQTYQRPMDVFAGLSAVFTRTPLITTERTDPMAIPKSFRSFLRIRVARLSSALVSNSEAGRTYWQAKLKPSVLNIVIRNAIPFDEIQSAGYKTTGLTVSADSQLVIYAGRLSLEKNVFNLLKSLNKVLTVNSKAIAVIFGDGSLRNDLSKLKEASVFRERIQIMGFSPQLWSWLKRATVFVSVSNFEGQPNAVLEAIASRCPVLVSDIPAHREFLDESCAYFVKPDSQEDIADGILDILSRPECAALRAKAAYERVSRWSVDAIAQQYIDLYEQILAKTKSP